MEMDFFTKSDIESSIKRINEILGSNIFHPKNSGHPLLRSAFIEMLIAMRDLMYKSEKYSSRISFDDDIVKAKKINDVSDTIKYIRDALCHPDSDIHCIEKGNIKATFNITYCKGVLMQSGDFQQASDYDDDVCFFFGSQKIYLKRHIMRAFEEAKEKLLPLIN